MTNITADIITVTQLPIITERLQTVKADISGRIGAVLDMNCTEETVKEAKKLRADFNTEFKDWEERRKAVKYAIMKPYEEFDEVYKACISDIFRAGDKALKEKIDEVEGGLRSEKEAEVRRYFDEYAAANGIDFVPFERAGIKITLSASVKSLKEQAKAFLMNVFVGYERIMKQELREEILVEFKKSLDALDAITTVQERHKAVEAEKERQAQREEIERREKEAAAKVETVIQALEPPKAEPEREDSKLEAAFVVRAALDELKALKKFLKENGYDFKGLKFEENENGGFYHE